MTFDRAAHEKKRADEERRWAPMRGLVVVGKGRAGQDERIRCECCGREILRLVYLGHRGGRPVVTVGWACAAKRYSSSTLAAARDPKFEARAREAERARGAELEELLRRRRGTR